MQPYKRCDSCGQPAVLSMVRCGRCGKPFTVVSGGSSSVGQPPTQQILNHPAGYPYSALRKPLSLWRILLIGALMMLSLAVVLGGMRRNRRHRFPQPAGLMFNLTAPAAQPGSEPSPSALQQPGTAPPVAGGLFQETNSAEETPVVTIYNVETDSLFMDLVDESGHSFHLASVRGMPGTVRLPSGDYRLRITSSDPRIGATEGTAIFRKHKQYSAVFHHDLPNGPVQIGD